MLLLFFKKILFISSESGGRKRNRETSMCERNIDGLPLAGALAGDQTYNPGMCPDWELNWRPFGLQDDTQPTEPHQSGPYYGCFEDEILYI